MAQRLPVKWTVAILIEGYLTIALEIIALRQLLPVLGNGIAMTSVVIGTVLLFMALGYYRGGKPCVNSLKRLQNNFLISSLIIGVGLSTFFIHVIFFFIASWVHFSFYTMLYGYLLITVAPCMFCLSQTAPTIMNELSNHFSAGKIGGTVLAMSTMGSFAGSFILAFFLMQTVGVSWTIVSSSFLALCLFYLFRQSKDALSIFISLFVVVLVSVSVYVVNIFATKGWFVVQNRYGDYQIIKKRQSNLLVINDSSSSKLDHKTLKGYPYIEQIRHLLFSDLQLKNKAILVIGAGGFTLTANGSHGNHVTYIDIDGQLPSIVAPSFIQKIHGSFVGESARYYLNTHSHQYDAIISDAYSNLLSMPPQLLTLEYVRSVKAHLIDGGVAIFNIIENPRLKDDYSLRVNATLQQGFDDQCLAKPSSFKHKTANVLYVCFKQNKAQSAHLYTDDKNTAALDAWFRSGRL